MLDCRLCHCVHDSRFIIAQCTIYTNNVRVRVHDCMSCTMPLYYGYLQCRHLCSPRITRSSTSKRTIRMSKRQEAPIWNKPHTERSMILSTIVQVHDVYILLFLHIKIKHDNHVYVYYFIDVYLLYVHVRVYHCTCTVCPRLHNQPSHNVTVFRP